VSPGVQERVPAHDGLETANQDEYAAAIGALVFEMNTRTSTAAQMRLRLRRESDPQLNDGGRICRLVRHD
jgi:hypothetical protein